MISIMVTEMKMLMTITQAISPFKLEFIICEILMYKLQVYVIDLGYLCPCLTTVRDR